jgi:hypothetical protein
MVVECYMYGERLGWGKIFSAENMAGITAIEEVCKGVCKEGCKEVFKVGGWRTSTHLLVVQLSRRLPLRPSPSPCPTSRLQTVRYTKPLFLSWQAS